MNDKEHMDAEQRRKAVDAIAAEMEDEGLRVLLGRRAAERKTKEERLQSRRAAIARWDGVLRIMEALGRFCPGMETLLSADSGEYFIRIRRGGPEGTCWYWPGEDGNPVRVTEWRLFLTPEANGALRIWGGDFDSEGGRGLPVCGFADARSGEDWAVWFTESVLRMMPDIMAEQDGIEARLEAMESPPGPPHVLESTPAPKPAREREQGPFEPWTMGDVAGMPEERVRFWVDATHPEAEQSVCPYPVAARLDAHALAEKLVHPRHSKQELVALVRWLLLLPFHDRGAPSAREMAAEFMACPLPDSVCSDAVALRQGPGRTGTNLLTMAEAETMMEHILASAKARSGGPERMSS